MATPSFPVGTDMRSVQAQIKISALNTLRVYNNNRVLELGLATKSYKYDFPYDTAYNVKDSNYRFALLIERQLFNKVPHLENTDCMFWNKTRNHVIICLKPSRLTTRFLGRVIRHCNAAGFPWLSYIMVNNHEVFSQRTRQNHPTLRIMIDLSVPIWGVQGICKLFFKYPEIEKILLNLQRLAFYEPTEITQTTQSTQDQAQSSARVRTYTAA